jgi:uncharacterized membrane protein
MTIVRRSGRPIALLVLSVVGVIVSLYLISVHYENVPLACSTQGVVDCQRVLSSSYSVVPGTSLPISVPGVLWFIVVGALAFMLWRVAPQRRDIVVGLFVWLLLGMLSVFYLIYVEIVRLHAICAWCTGLHAIILVMFLISIFQLYQGTVEDEEAYEEDDERRQSSVPMAER